MLYWLSAFADTIGLLNVLRYITFRTGGAMITALIFVFLFGPTITAMLRLRPGQQIWPAGLVILSAVTVATLLWARLANSYVWIVVGVALGLGLLGFRDDYLKAKQSALSERLRIAITTSVALAACLALVFLARPPTATLLPSGKAFAVDLGWLYVVVAAFTIVAASNAASLA